MTEPINFNFEQFIDYMNISRTVGYRLVHNESFYPAFRIGRKILINVEKLKQWNSEQSMNSEEANGKYN